VIAASDKHETLELMMSRENSGGSRRKRLLDRIHYNYDNPEIVKVDAHPLDEMLKGKKYDSIFMDIEGSEYFALKRMQRLLADARPLSVEFLPFPFVDVAGVTAEQFLEQIMPHFEWMYIPGRKTVTPKSEIAAVIVDMFARDERHDNLYFLKEVSRRLHGLSASKITSPSRDRRGLGAG
jgi:hypothetical protein